MIIENNNALFVIHILMYVHTSTYLCKAKSFLKDVCQKLNYLHIEYHIQLPHFVNNLWLLLTDDIIVEDSSFLHSQG